MKPLIALLLACAAQAHAVVGGYVPSEKDYSLDAVGAFGVAWHLGLDPTHPDARDHEWFCAATLVAPDVIVTAKHCLDVYGENAAYAVRFRRAEDDSLGSIAAGPGSYFHASVGNWYIPSSGQAVLGYLKDVVYHIAPLPIRFAHSAAPAPLTIAGWGREGPHLGEGPKRELRGCASEQIVGPGAGYFIWVHSPWDAAGEPNGWCGPNSNDSGGALVEWFSGVPRLIGAVQGSDFAQYSTDAAFVAVAEQ